MSEQFRPPSAAKPDESEPLGTDLALTLSARAATPRWLLPTIVGIPYLVMLGARPLVIPDETRYAEISREMLATGDWIVPQLLGLRYFEKPVGGYWLNSLSQMIFGHNNFGVRFSSALATVITGLLILLLVRRAIGNTRQGCVAATIYLSSFLVWAIGTTAVLDSMLTMWLTAALVAFWLAFSTARRGPRLAWWAVFGISSGAAFLTKGFVALAVVVVVVAPFMLWERRWKEMLLYGTFAAVVAVALALPWAAAIHERESGFWDFFFWNENIRRFTSSHAQHPHPFWYYVPCLAAMTLPWIALVPSTLRQGWRRAVTLEDGFHRFVGLALLMPFLLFSTAEGKLATYVLPCAVPFSILMAGALTEGVDRGAQRPLRATAWTTLALSGAGLGSLLLGKAVVAWSPYPHSPGSGRVATVVLLAWLALGIGMLRKRIPYVAGIASMVVSVALAQPFLIPRDVRSNKMPGELLAGYRDRLGPDVTLASASAAMSPAVAWVFRRSDVVIVGGPGEFEYGLGYPGTEGRIVRKGHYASWLRKARKQHPVVLFVRSWAKDALDRYPAPSWLERNGALAVLYYEKSLE